MAIRHGRRGYSAGCRCDECTTGQRVYQRQYRERVAAGTNGRCSGSDRDLHVVNENINRRAPGPVEVAVESELAGLAAAQLRPSLAAVALAMARILDGRVPTPKPAAAKVLVTVLDTLHKGSAQTRRSNLALVRSLTEKGDA